MNLSKVDLNLFIVFDAIYTEANLTRAGQIVGITQPAVSNALARLRDTFNDPLFVRTAQGMVPTPMAQNIITPVRQALQLLRVSVQESRSFNPTEANKTYRISMTDLTEAVILPHLAGRIRRLARNINIDSFLTRRRETTKELAAGRLDFAIDAPLNTDPQVRHVRLFEDRYVCIMRKGHPLAGKESITLDDYLAQSQIGRASCRESEREAESTVAEDGIRAFHVTGVQTCALPICRRETTKELAAGRLDFAIDAPLNTDPQVRHVRLFEDRYVCIMRKGHPLAGKESITLDDYLAQS